MNTNIHPLTVYFFSLFILSANPCLAMKLNPLPLFLAQIPLTAAFIPHEHWWSEYELPSEISKRANMLPQPIKEKIYGQAVSKFKNNSPNFDKQVSLNTADLEKENFLSDLDYEFDEPDYYKHPVHLPLDGVNNGLSSAKMAAAAHDALWKDVLGVRGIIYLPAYQKLKQLIVLKNATIRIAFIGCGWGGDMLNFIEWLKLKDPSIIEYLEIDGFDLSRSFLDKGAIEIHRRLGQLGFAENTPYEKVAEISRQLNADDQLAGKRLSINNSQLGYYHPTHPIKRLFYKDVSKLDLVDCLAQQGVIDAKIKKYDLAFSMFVFHEQPPSAINNTLINFSQLADSLYFIDMDFQRKIRNIDSDIGSFFLGKIFEATEPFARFLSTENVNELFSQYGEIRKVEQQQIESDATVQACILEFSGAKEG